MAEFALIAAMRDEGPRLIDWVAHHRAIGFDAILVASNDCTDGTDALLDRLMELGHLRHVRNMLPYKPFSIRMSAYERLRVWPEVANATWLMALDADEYLGIHTGDGTLRALVATLPEAEAVAIPRRLFGTGAGEGCIADTHLACAAPDVPDGAKILARHHTRFPLWAEHGPRLPGRTPPERGFDLTTVTAGGEALPPRSLTTPGSPFEDIPGPLRRIDAAQINHYAAPSALAWLAKCRRGSADSRDPEAVTDPDPRAFAARDRTETRDDRRAGRTEARDAWRASLRADARLADLEAAALAHEADLLGRLRTDPALAALSPKAVPGGTLGRLARRLRRD